MSVVKYWSALLSLLFLLSAGCNPRGIVTGYGEDSGYSWMGMYLPWRVETIIPGMDGSYSKKHPLPAVTLTRSQPFTIYICFGSNHYDCYNTVRISSDGLVVAAYKDPKVLLCYEKKFRITTQQVSELASVLRKNAAGNFAASYVDTDVKSGSGTQAGFTFITGGSKRRTYFSNAWPQNFRNICDYVCDNILKFDPGGGNYGYARSSNCMLIKNPEATAAARGKVRVRDRK